MSIVFDSVDRLYYSVTRITTHHYTHENLVDPNPIKIATGFFYHNISNDQRFLITNRHLIVKESERYFPNAVCIKLHTDPNDLKQNRDYDIPLYKSAKKLWLEPKEGNADVVAIKIDLSRLVQQRFIATFFASKNILPTNMRLHVADDVFVMGYPLGTYDEIHNLPITRNGTISSAYPVYFNEKPYFLVDANLQEGASGGPVITKFKYIRPIANGGSIFSGPSCYITCKQHFQLHKNKKGEICRSKGEDYWIPRKISIFESSKKFSIDSIEIEPLSVDHSIPGVCDFILHTSNGSIGYTADLRFHGRRTSETENFVQRCGNSDLSILLCEGTRINEEFSKTESDVKKDVTTFANQTQELVICTYPERDLDRLLSFYNAAESGRDLVISLKQAYLLKLFQTSESLKAFYPRRRR